MAGRRRAQRLASRPAITCSSCGRERPHKAYGRCSRCDHRWRYFGRPADGPPPPGQGLPPQGSVAHTCPSPACAGCDLNRAWAEHLAFKEHYRPQWRAAQARRAAQRRAERHAGHTMAIGSRGPFCLSCRRGETSLDEMAVERAVIGQPPPRMSPAEREAAVIRLRLSTDLPYTQIAEHAGCTQRTVIRICKTNNLLRSHRAPA